MTIKNSKYAGRMGKRYKSIQLDTKEVSFDSDSRTISGYAAVFGNIDKASDLLVKGCFAKSIQERGPESNANDKIAFLWQHDMNEPIARITVLKEDDHGLYFEAIVDQIDLGDRALKQLESGTLNQFSFGYRYVWEKCEWDTDRDCFIVKEVILYELSVVTIGCNRETEYLGLKTSAEYESEYKKLDDELDIILKGLNKDKQQKIQRILAKAMTLASIKPDEERKSPPTIPLEEEEAGKGKSKSMFDNLIK